MTLARMIRLFKVPSTPHLGNSLREMEEEDVPAVAALYTRYMQRFDMAPAMSVDEVRHQLLSGKGTGEKKKEDSRREGQVVWTYVVEVNMLRKITYMSVSRN
jgi:glycylpeptide N-tetradecanoyltransferase